MTLSITETKYVALSACAEEVNFVSMVLEEMTEVENPSVVYEDNQGIIFLAKNRQVGIRTDLYSLSFSAGRGGRKVY